MTLPRSLARRLERGKVTTLPRRKILPRGKVVTLPRSLARRLERGKVTTLPRRKILLWGKVVTLPRIIKSDHELSNFDQERVSFWLLNIFKTYKCNGKMSLRTHICCLIILKRFHVNTLNLCMWKFTLLFYDFIIWGGELQNGSSPNRLLRSKVGDFLMRHVSIFFFNNSCLFQIHLY